MTQEELNYIKDSFSQILDDIGGNPDWYDAAKAIASDLGTMEKQLEERVTKLPSNLDEAAKKYADDSCFDDPEFTATMLAFKAGAEWMAGHGETIDGEILTTSDYGWETIRIPKKLYPLGTKVTIQIRKKNDL